MREVEVVGVKVERPSNQPVVILREAHSWLGAVQRYVPVWVGPVEASAIAAAQQFDLSDRPPTHALFASVIDALDDVLVTVEIVDVRNGVFYAQLEFASGVRVDARPSDSIALALRTGALIMCSEAVLDEVGIINGVLVDDDYAEEAEVADFRDFLDRINPDDFAR